MLLLFSNMDFPVLWEKEHEARMDSEGSGGRRESPSHIWGLLMADKGIALQPALPPRASGEKVWLAQIPETEGHGLGL